MKENLKNKEMNRIFIEYQKNHYFERYNVDKNTLLNALVGEENLMTEVYNQSKRENQYNDYFSKIRMYKKENIKNNILYKNNSCLNLRNNKILEENENINTIANCKINLKYKFQNNNKLKLY